MEWFYAKDGKQVGPLTGDVLRGLIGSGQVASGDLVWKEGMAEWLAAGQMAELQAGAAPLTQLDGSPLPPSAMPPTQNGMALASMILGICSFVTCTWALAGIPGVICGHIANRQMRESPFPQTGQGMAKAGLILSYIATVMTVLIVFAYMGLFAAVRKSARSSSTLSSPAPVTAPAVLPSAPTGGVLPEEAIEAVEEGEAIPTE